jgi:hypothetical protein
VATNISQRFAKTGDFYLLEDTDLRGGMRVVSSLAARDAIPIQARKSGMLVRVVEGDKISMWELPFGKPITNTGWTEAKLGGGDFIPTAGGNLEGELLMTELGSMNFNNALKAAVYDGNLQFTVAADLDPDDPEPKSMMTFNDGVKNTIEINPVIGQIVCSTEVGLSSDRSLKTNIRRVEDSLKIVRRINGYTFEKIGQKRRFLGVIANELLQVLPEAVTRGSDGKLVVFYGSLAGLFIENIRALDEMIIANKKESDAAIEDFEKRLTEIEEKLQGVC